MQPFIANTDKPWFDFLSTQIGASGRIDEVNFWQPKSTRPMKRMAPGEPVFFRLKKPDFAVAGFGFFAHFEVVSVEEAWDLFGWKNGAPTRMGFLRSIGGFRGEDLSRPENRRKPLGCTILREATFWPDALWVPWRREMGWHDNIVQGKTERDPRRAALLLDRLAGRLDPPPDLAEAFRVLDVDEDQRRRVVAEQLRREGQGTFRLRLMDAYGRCAITGEKTRPVLDAAHIQPYLGPSSNHVQNGLLLTKEFHALFDRGYVTVTPDHEVQVSEALREHWQNGVRYYAYHGRALKKLPEREQLRPSRDALAWHRENVFLG